MNKYLFIFITALLFSCENSKEIKRQQLFLKGNIALEENNIKQAIYYYDQCIEMNDTIPDPYNNRAIAHERLGDIQDAFNDYERAIIIDPTYYKAYFNRARLLVDIQNYKSAILNLQQIEKAYADSATFYFVRGLAQNGLRNYSDALADFQFAKKLQPDNQEIDINIATVLYFQGEIGQSLSILNQISNIKNIPEALNLKALLLIEKKQFNEAEQLINDALKITSNSYYYNNRGYIRLLKGDLESGIKDINQSLLMDDKNSWAFRNKGYYFYLSKDYDQAIQFLKTSLELDPNVTKSHYFLGLSYYEIGEKELACLQWQMAFKNGEKESAVSIDQYCTQ